MLAGLGRFFGLGAVKRRRRVGARSVKGVRCAVHGDALRISFGPVYFKQAVSRKRGGITDPGRTWWVETCLTDPGYLVRYGSVGWTGSDVAANRVWHQGAEVCAARAGRVLSRDLPTYVGLTKGKGRGTHVRHGGVCPAGVREGSFVARRVRSGAAPRRKG